MRVKPVAIISNIAGTVFRSALSLGLLISLGTSCVQAAEEASRLARDDLMRSLMANPVLNIAQLETSLSNQARPAFDARLRLAELYLDYGMQSAAEQALRQVAFDADDRATANQAWFLLAKLRYEREDMQGAQQAIKRVRKPDPEHPEQPLLAAEIRMAQDDFATAAKILGKADDAQSMIISYNHGVALIRSGKDRKGEQVLTDLVKQNADNEQDAAVLDRAHLVLGHYYLDKGRFNKANDQFLLVRASSPYAHDAMLGAGLAQLKMPGPRVEQTAMPPSLFIWHQLIKGDTADFATLEAMLAIPASYTKQGDYSNAVMGYEKALTQIEQERTRVEQVKQQVDKQGVISLFKPPQHAPQRVGWLRRTPAVEGGAETYYLQTLLASHDFQETLKNYRDLQDLEQSLNQMHDRLIKIATPETQAAAMAPLQARIKAMTPQVQVLRMRHQQALNLLTQQDLERRLRYLTQLTAQANLGLAQAYDRMSRGGSR